jgi:hypothetical protein
MSLTLTVICVAVAVYFDRNLDQAYKIPACNGTAQHYARGAPRIASNQEVLLFDVRQPLDLLGASGIALLPTVVCNCQHFGSVGTRPFVKAEGSQRIKPLPPFGKEVAS